MLRGEKGTTSRSKALGEGGRGRNTTRKAYTVREKRIGLGECRSVEEEEAESIYTGGKNVRGVCGTRCGRNVQGVVGMYCKRCGKNEKWKECMY
jgi:hypothetical protein